MVQEWDAPRLEIQNEITYQGRRGYVHVLIEGCLLLGLLKHGSIQTWPKPPATPTLVSFIDSHPSDVHLV